MKILCHFLTLTLAAILSTDSLLADDNQTSSNDVIVPFNGENLSGWKGREDLWSAEDGQIVGRTTDEDPIDGNTFLIWEGGTPSDFELTTQFKIEGGNSGIQYRSKVVDEEKFVVAGYQADIDSTNRYSGILYEEKGRGILAQRGQKVTITEAGKKNAESFADAAALAKGIHPGKWNDYRIVADGNHLRHYINGTLTAEVIDNQSEKAAEDGVIALQLHRGPAMTIRFKKMKIRKLN